MFAEIIFIYLPVGFQIYLITYSTRSRHNEAILFRLTDLLQDEAGHFHELLFHLVATDAGLASHFNVVLEFRLCPRRSQLNHTPVLESQREHRRRFGRGQRRLPIGRQRIIAGLSQVTDGLNLISSYRAGIPVTLEVVKNFQGNLGILTKVVGVIAHKLTVCDEQRRRIGL